MKQLNDNELVYKRGTVEITIENFTPEKIDVSELGQFGITLVREKAVDFVFDTSDLSSLSPSEPQQGDQLIWNSRTYEVMTIGEELFNYTTTSRVRIRVHAKQTE